MTSKNLTNSIVCPWCSRAIDLREFESKPLSYSFPEISEGSLSSDYLASPKILLVEDDPESAKSTVNALESFGHIVKWAATKNEGKELLSVYNFDLIILDWNLDEENSLELCQEFRLQGVSNNILVLIAKSAEASNLSKLTADADDYLKKPFAISELNARVRALLCRPKTSPRTLKSGEIEIDVRRAVVIRKGEEIPMRKQEIALLSFLMRNREEFFSSSELLRRVWGVESGSSEEAVRKTINRIRIKLDTVEGSYISNVKNLGYKINTSGRL